MIRAYLYLLVAGIIWMVEGFLFSHYLGFAIWQMVLIGVMYAALFGVFVRRLLQSLRTAEPPPIRPAARVARSPWYIGVDADSGPVDGMSAWRMVTLVPMLVVLVGSFASLPLVILVAILGKI